MFDFGVSALLIEGPFEIGFCAVWFFFFSFKISAHVIRCAGHEILKRLRLPDMNSDELLRKEGRKKKLCYVQDQGLSVLPKPKGRL